MSLFTGMRAAEVARPQWGDITDTYCHVKDPKNGQNRVAYHTPEIAAMLSRRKGMTPRKPTDRVFPAGLGSADKPEISATFARCVDRMGLNDGITDKRQMVVFHTLRHTFASWHVQAGTPLYDVQKLMGHKSISQTQVYAKLAPEGLQARAQVLSGMLD